MVWKLGIIGGGHMGSAIARGGIERGLTTPEQIVVVEIDPIKRAQLAELGCETAMDPVTAMSAEQIILAVKPQAFPEIARAIAPVQESKVIISVMAGLHSRSIRKWLGNQARIVRAMPNVPCQIGAGMTAIALGEGARPGDEMFALSIFNALGKTVMVDESLMHAVTAVSGSGPAYVFLLAEAMERAAIEIGLDEPTARLLVIQTIAGSGRLLEESGRNPLTLRQAVTSPGGTTAAALDLMFQRDLVGIIIDALTAARDRGRELDGQ